MACSKEDKEKIISSDNFKKFYNTFEEEDLDYVFSEYIRKKHAERSSEYIKKFLKDKIKYKNIEFSQQIANICLGHTLDNDSLKNEKLFPKTELIESHECNIHYLALILRIADYLDIFPFRTPTALYKFVSPQNHTSIKEWEKHLSISGWIFNSKSIRIAANCKNIEYERAVRETIIGINKEKGLIYNSIKNYEDGLSKKYKFLIQDEISLNDIKNDGSYIFDNLEFNIDYKSVMTLLMGEKLYDSPEVALRELLQNSIDAINFRKKLQKEDFEPNIEINFDGKTLSISDNGIGMDDYVFKNYFLKVGKSFYKSKDARSLVSDYDSISEFGIGILSCFMVAESIEVESKRFSQDTNKPNEPICIEIPTAYGYMIKKKTNKQQVGTKITLTLKKSHPFKCIKTLITKIAPFIAYDITLSENGKTSIIYPKTYDKTLVDELVKPYKCEICFEVDLAKSKNNIIKSIEGKIFFVSLKSQEYNMDDWKYFLKRYTYQNGFLVENQRDKENNENDIFPYCGDVVIVANFKNQSALKLSADRTRFIEDEKYRQIEKLIEEEIANKLYEYFLPYYKTLSLEDYYKFQYKFLSKFYMDLDFLVDKKNLSKIVFVGILSKKGAIKYIPVSELVKCREILYPEDFYSKKEPYRNISERKILLAELEQIFGNNFKIPVLIKSAANCNADSMFFGLYHPSIKAYCLTTTNRYGALKLLDITEKDEFPDEEYKLGELRFVDEIYSPFPDNKPLFLNYEFANMHFNINHTFFKSFMKNKLYENDLELKNKLVHSLTPLLEINKYNAIKKYKSAFKAVWANLKKAQIISKNQKMPTLTLNDLPLNQLR